MTLAARLRGSLAAGAPTRLTHEGPDHDGAFAPAAVLIAITDRPQPGVILTLRQAGLRRHAGQYAFPGGRIDPGDTDAIAAALREAEEEIALPPSSVEVVAERPAFTTGSGFAITPVIGVIPPDLPLVPHAAEVAETFEVPLAFLIDPANHGRATMPFPAGERLVYEIRWNAHRIWGITAAIIVDLARSLEGFA